MTETNALYPLDKCDVTDKKLLKKFRKNRERWLDYLSDDKEHSVWNQIYAMIWSSSVYNILNHSRRIAEESGSNSFASLNGTIGRFIDYAFVESQSLAIRKLIDRRSDVVSLRFIIKDLRDKIDTITRENYVCFDGAPYDYIAVELKLDQKLTDAGMPTLMYGDLRGPNACYTSRLTHQNFDFLSGTQEYNRSRSDKIREEILDRLDNIINTCGAKNFINYANTFVAHAANKANREKFESLAWKPTLGELYKSHKALCQVASAIYGKILWIGASGLVPTANYDKFQNLDKPWVQEDKICELHREWDYFKAEIENWSREDIFDGI